MTVESPTPFERFKWTVLFDLVFEDYQGLWEPLWSLRGSEAVEGQAEVERQAWAERAIRELHRDGLIYFFRVPRSAEINESGLDPDLRLSEAELDQTLGNEWWRVPLGESLPPDHPNIWIGPTPEGEAAAKNPPEAIRKLYPL